MNYEPAYLLTPDNAAHEASKTMSTLSPARAPIMTLMGGR